MTAKLTHVLSIDASALGLVGVVRADIRLIRTSASDSFVSIPDNFRVQVDLIDGLGSVRLFENTYGSIYDCTLYAANSKKASQFFFNMPDADASLTDLSKLTAWPDSEDTSTVPTPTVGLVDLDDVDDSAATGKFLTEVNPVDGVRQFGFEQVSIDDVLGLPDALGNRSEVGHTHPFDTLTNQPTEYPPSAHYHTINETVDLPETIGSLNAQDATLQANIDAEAAARDAADVVLNQALAMVGGGAKAYQTKALMDAVTPTDPNQLSYVTNDPTTNNNGLYGWTGSAWVKSVYDPLAQALAALAVEVLNRKALISTGDFDFNFTGADYFNIAKIKEGFLGVLNLIKIIKDAGNTFKFVNADNFLAGEFGSDFARFFGKLSTDSLQLNGSGSGFDFIGNDGFKFAEISPNFVKFAGLKIMVDNSQKLRFVGDDYFVIAEFPSVAASVTQPTVISVTAPLFCGPLVTFTNQPTFIDVASLVAQRGLINSTRNLLATISDQSGKGFSQSRESIRFDAAEYTSSGYLTLCDTANNPNNIARIPLTFKTAPIGLTGQANKNILVVGDSITNRGLCSLIKSYLASYGYSVTFVGTLKGSLDGETSTQTGGEYGEGREGHETGDYTYRYTDRVQIVGVGNEQTYLNLGLSDKNTAREYNPFLRAATGGDNAGVINNGYVFDAAFYQSRFASTSKPVPTPDVVITLLGTNNSRDRDGPTLSTEYAEDLTLMLNSYKSAWPSAKLIVGMQTTSSTTDRDAVFEAEYAPMIRALINLKNSISGLIVAPIWALAPSEVGYSITTGSATTDSVTGALIGGLADDIHPQYSGRYQLAHTLAAYSAASIQALI